MARLPSTRHVDVTSTTYRIIDLGDRRLLTVDGREYATRYSERLIRMLIDRKGVARTPPYLTYKETRGAPLFGHLRRRQGERRADAPAGRGDAPVLRVLEVGCSFGHLTEYLCDQPEVTDLYAFDTDPAFVEMTATKVDELGLRAVREVRCLSNDQTRSLPYRDGFFDLVLAVGVVEHLPVVGRAAHVDEWYRVLAPGGLIAILDTPNRAFPLETHSVGLPLVQWLPPALAWRYARTFRPSRFRAVPLDDFLADGTGWRNASFRECLPSAGLADLDDVTEEVGYGWAFFRGTARSRARRAAIPVLSLCERALRVTGRSPSRCLPYLNLLFRKRVPHARYPRPGTERSR